MTDALIVLLIFVGGCIAVEGEPGTINAFIIFYCLLSLLVRTVAPKAIKTYQSLTKKEI